MDSSGLDPLFGCLKAARRDGVDVRIAAVQRQVSMVLTRASMDKVRPASVIGLVEERR